MASGASAIGGATAPAPRMRGTIRVFEGISFWVIPTILITVPVAFTSFTPDSGDVKPLISTTLVMVGLVAWVVGGALRGEVTWPRTRVALPLLVFMVLNLVSLALSSFPRASWREVWRVTALAGVFFLGLQAARCERRVKYVAPAIAATAGVVALYGLLQRLGLDPITWVGAVARGRSFSTLSNPNFLAAYLVMSLPVTGALFLSCGTRRLLALLGADVAIQAVCLVFTFSRGGWLGALGAAVVFAFLGGFPSHSRGFLAKLGRRGWMLTGMVVASVAVVSVVGSSYSPFRSKAAATSIRTRVLVYEGGVRMFAARPVLGHGAGTFHTVFPEFRPREYPEVDPRPNVKHAHCEYLNIADELGVIGLGVFAWLALSVLYSGYAAIRAAGTGPPRLMLTGFLAGAFGLLVHGTFSVVLRTTVPALHLWFVFGFLAAWAPRGLRKVTLPLPARAAIAAAAGLVGALLVYQMNVRPFASNVVEHDGSALKRQGRWEDATAKFRRAVEIDPWNLEARYLEAVSLVELERYGEAMEAYRGIEALSPDYVHIHYNMGMLYAFLHDWENAEDEFRKADGTAALPFGFELQRALDVMGSAEADKAKELAIFAMVAKARFVEEARLRAMKPDAVEAKIAAKGTSYYLAGRLGRAEALFQLALSYKPDDRKVLNNLAGIYFQRKNYDKAIELCERLLRLSPDDAHVATNLAKTWLVKGETAKAKRILEGVLSANPGYPDAVRTMRLLRQRR